MIGCSQPRTRLGCDGVLAEVVGQHLVDADAALQLGALLERRAGEDVAGLPGVDADAGGVLLNRPLMTLIFVFSGASGSRLLPSSIVRAGALGPPVVAG